MKYLWEDEIYLNFGLLTILFKTKKLKDTTFVMSFSSGAMGMLRPPL